MRNVIVLSGLLLLGCSEVVEPWHPVGEPQVVEATAHCTYAGYCLDVATIGMDMKFRLGPSMGFRLNCSGRKPARVRTQPFEQKWSNGHIERMNKTEVLETWGECK